MVFCMGRAIGYVSLKQKTEKKDILLRLEKKRPIPSLIYLVTPFALICIVYLLYFFFL